MGFLGLGRSSLKHTDPKRREEAVRSMPVAEQGMLARIALGDADAGVRMAAASKVQDAELLTHLARHRDVAVARLAGERLAAQGLDRLRAAPLAEAVAALPTLEQSALLSLVYQAEDPALRCAAAERLLDLPEASPAALSALAVRDEVGAHGLRALARLDRRQSIKEVAKKAKVEAVRARARERLADLDAEAARPSAEARRRARAEALLSLIDRVRQVGIGTVDPAADRAAVTRLVTERDDVLAAETDLELDDRAHQALAALARTIEQVEQRIAAAEAAEAQQQSIDRERRGWLDALEEELAASEDRAALLAEAGTAWAAFAGEPEPELAARWQALHAQSEQATEAVATAVAVELAPEQIERIDAILAEAETLAEAEGSWRDADQRFKVLDKEWRIAAGDLGNDDARRQRFLAAFIRFKERRRAARESRGLVRAERLQRMQTLVEQAEALAAVAAQVDNLAAHEQALKDLQQSWRQVGPVPAADALPLRHSFRSACDAAWLPLRAAREAEDWERFAKVPQAEELIARAESLDEIEEPEALHVEVKTVQRAWKELGGLPRERRDELWQAFKAACDRSYERLQPWFAERDRDRDVNRQAKERLLEKLAAQLDDSPIGITGSQADFDAQQARAEKVKALQAEWREIGPAPREHDQPLWDRYKALLDRFYQQRRLHHASQDEARGENLVQREALCAEAEDLAGQVESHVAGTPVGRKNESDYLSEIKAMQRRAREIGPVPRDHYRAVRERFDAACNRVYAALEPWFAKQDEDRRGNLERKQALLAEMEGLLEEERPDWFRDEAKRIATAWREVGPVPRDQMAINDRFRELAGRLLNDA